MCKYFIEIVKAANFGQNPYKLSFAIQYRETSHSPSPPVESSYVQISPSQYTVFGQCVLLQRAISGAFLAQMKSSAYEDLCVRALPNALVAVSD